MGWVRRAIPWIGLWVLVLAPRLWVLGTQDTPTPPGAELERTAACLAERGFLGDPFPGHDRPSAHVAPLYPAVLGVVYTAFGNGEAGHRVQAVVTILIMGTGISLLPAVGRALCGSGAAGWLAAVLMAVLPFGIASLQVWGPWEQPLSFTGVAVLLLGMRAVQRAGWPLRHALCLGAGAGVLALVNPQFGLVLGAFAAAELVRTRRMATLHGVALACAACGLVLLPWALRNYFVLGGFCPVRSNSGLELAMGNNDWATGRTHTMWTVERGHPLRSFHPFVSADQMAELRRVGELEYMAERRREAVAWIRAHPERFVQLTGSRVRLFWFPTADMWPATEAEKASRRLLIHAVLSGLMVLGLVRLAWRDLSAFVAAASVLLGLSLSYYVTHVDLRYIFPVLGVSLVLACDVVVAVGKWLLGVGGRSHG